MRRTGILDETPGGALAVIAALVFFGAVLASTPVLAESGSKDGEGADAPAVYLHHPEDVGKGVSSIVARRIGSVLRDQLSSNPGVDLADAFEPGELYDGKSISDAKSLYTSGIGLLRAGEYKRAKKKLESAVKIFDRRLVYLRDYDVLADAYANLAAAYHHAGYDFDARKYIKRFAHLRPNAELTRDWFPPELKRKVSEEQKNVDEAGTGTLQVKTNPKGAVIYLDGEKKGTSPVTLEGVTYGFHYIAAEGEKRRARAVRVFGRDKKQQLKFDLSKDAENQSEDIPAFYRGMRQTLRTGSFGEGLTPYLDELARRMDAEIVVWSLVMAEKDKYRVLPFAYRVSDGRMIWITGATFSKQLSNLRNRADKVTENIVEAVESMPESHVVESVELDVDVPEQSGERIAVRPTASETGGDVEAEAGGSEGFWGSDRFWTYAGIGGGVLVTAGLVAGGVALFGDNEKGKVNQFNVEVAW